MKANNNTIKVAQKVSLQDQKGWIFPFPPNPFHNREISTFYPFNHPYDYLYHHSAPNTNYFRSSYHPYDNFSHLGRFPPQKNPSLPSVKIQDDAEEYQNAIKILSEPIKINKIRSQNIEKSLQYYSSSEAMEKFNFIKEKKVEKEMVEMENESLLTYTKPYIKELVSIFKSLIEKLLDEDQNFKDVSQKCQRLIMNMSQYDEEGTIESNQQRQRRQLFFTSLMNKLQEKYKKFKKTKQEMIKYIIRRTYHSLKINKQLYNKPQYDRLETFHQKNISTYKSMNTNFLRRQFSNPLFLTVFKRFLSHMDTQLQAENQEKIIKLSHTLSKCWALKSSNDLMNQRKMPWVASYKVKVKKIANDMLQNYGYNDLKEEVIKKQEKK